MTKLRQKRLHQKLTNEQCCMAIAMMDVLGEEAASKHFGVTKEKLKYINNRLRARPDLDEIYWYYRNSMGKRWMNQISETIVGCASKLGDLIHEKEPNIFLMREITSALRVLGEIAVSSSAVAPEGMELEAIPRYQIESEEEEGEIVSISSKY